MAKKKKDAEGGKKGKTKMVIGAVVGAALLYNFVLKPKPQPADEGAALGGSTTIAEGEVVVVPEMVLNLADTDTVHYLRIGVAVVLAEGVSAEEFEKETPKVSDIVIDVVGELTFAELQTPGARQALKQDLTDRAQEEFNEGDGGQAADDEPADPVVARILLTSFVMQ